MLGARGARAGFAAGGLALLGIAAGAARAEGTFWGRDINPGEGPRVIEEARPGLLAVVKASEADRPAAVRAFAEKAETTSEGWKRFRNPELKPLFLKLLDHPDWRTAHRALFALEYYRDPAALGGAWRLLFHAEPRMREKAAIACIKLWDAGAAKDLSQGDWRGALDALLTEEKDLHVRRCLEALKRRTEGKLPVVRVHEEFTVRGPDGLLLTPFLEGMDKARQVAPGYAPKGSSLGGGGSAAKLPVVETWTTPVLGYGREEVPGTGLQPFANPRENGVVHTGQDLGACLDGAGYYAIADGIVKWVHSGSDMGTLLVLEHHLSKDGVVCAVYMHGGDTAFVKGGDRVEAGQLLGTMGMGFSLENGGHFAHLHFGLYPGPFQTGHNYGYKKAADGLSDWFDPAKRLPLWQDGNRPTAEEGPDSITARAARLRKAGYPAKAMEVLERGERVLRGKPGGESVADSLASWRKDDLLQKALAGERKIEAAEDAAAKAGKKDADRVRAMWQALLDEYGGTDLAGRIREAMK